MTREEKLRFLFDHCKVDNCPECVLRDGSWEHILCSESNCLAFHYASDAEIDLAVELIKNGGKSMTIEEKKKAIREWCDRKNPHGCSVEPKCPLYGFPEPWCDYGASDETVERNYAILFGEHEETIESDPVNHADHYNAGDIECIDAIEASMSPIEYAGFLKGQVIKYLWRYRHKGKAVQDLKKAEYYHARLIAVVEKEEVKA